MTSEENKILEETKQVIEEETKKISDSVTRILMIGGPRFVAAILTSLLEANNSIMKDLKIKTELEFEEGEG